jgi:hypothetical protein
MNARLALRFACTAALVGLMTGCASGDSGDGGETPAEGGGDSTMGPDARAEGSADAGGPDGGPAETGKPDATAEGGADSGGTDASADATLGDTGGQDSTVADAASQDSTVDDTAAPDAMDAANDTGLTDTSAADAGADSTLDSGVDTGAPDAGADAETDASGDGGSDAAPDTGDGQGPACRASDGGIYRCNTGEHCCANAMTQASSCATACNPDAGTYPVDCAGSTGDGQCGGQICCGTLVLSGGTVPNCSASSLVTSCATTCTDNPPGTFSGCMGNYTIRLCNATADCTNDTGRPVCCRFGASPVYWCVDTFTALVAPTDGGCFP